MSTAILQTSPEIQTYADITRETLESLSNSQLHRLCNQFGVTVYDMLPKFRHTTGACGRPFSISVQALLLLAKRVDEAVESGNLSQASSIYQFQNEMRSTPVREDRPRNELIGELLQKANNFRAKARRREAARLAALADSAASEERRLEESRNRIFVIGGQRYKLVPDSE